MTDNQEPPVNEVLTKRSLRNNAVWKIGEKLPFNLMPTVEGMVVATRWVDESFMVVFLVPPYKKEGGTWAEAALAYKTAALITKEPLLRYDFPFPKDYRIGREVNRANGNVEILQEIVAYINKAYPPPSNVLVDTPVEPSLNPWGTEDAEATAPPPSNDDRLSLHMLLSQQGESHTEETNQVPDQLVEKIIHEISNQFQLSQKNPTKNSDDESYVSEKGRPCRKTTKKKKKSSSSSSSTSSASSSYSSSSDSDVRLTREEKAKGWVKCPFSCTDSRMMITPREKMKSTSTERVMLRKALHNLYNHFTTLKWFVETQKGESAPSAIKPYASDIVWLNIHANYLDQLLLQPMAGAWTSWNELIVDDITRSFLELVVRTSPERKYPDIIDEKVRKWMKRKRIGLTSSFGSIPTFLADAKITEAGIQPKGGWETLKKRDKVSTFPTRTKPAATLSTTADKKQ